jgi:hypothetical protein
LAFGVASSGGPVHAQPASAKTKAEGKGSQRGEAGKEEADSETGLPPGYEPPADPPDVLLVEQPLLTPEERDQFKKKELSSYLKRIRTGDIRSEESKAIIRNGIRYRLNELTLKENRKDLARVRERLTAQDLRQAGTVGLAKADQIRDFRQQLLTIVVEETEKLFDNNGYVRIQAAILLGELNLIEDDDPAKGLKREAFALGARPLCKVIKDPEQPEAVKIVSVLSMIRILRQGNPNVELKRDIATAMISELKRTDTHVWYQTRLAEGLGGNDVPLDLNREPFVFNTLNAVMKDPKRDLQVRAQAAWSLGRHPLVPQVDLRRLAADVVAVGYDLAKAQSAKPGVAQWKRCSFTLYLAFQAKDKDDLDATRQHPGGLFNLNPAPRAAEAAEIKAAYDQLLPVIVAIIAGDPVPPEQIQAMGQWLDARAAKPAPSDTSSNGATVGGPG